MLEQIVSSATVARCFSQASRYPRTPWHKGALREPRSLRRFPWSERHLQCVWFDPTLRPEKLPVNQGEWLVVEHPGVWNLDEGPDFLGAVVRMEPAQRRIAGDVEVHVHPGDWHVHGHDRDPRYARVRIHVTYFPGGGGPESAMQVALAPILAARPEWDLDCLDVTAYPYAARGASPPCATYLAHWNAGQIEQFLNAAGEERLRRKAERLQTQIELRGLEQTFYSEILAALGYKHNKAVCRRLAEAVPVQTLREEANGSAQRAYALLAGVAGLLPATDDPRWDDATKRATRTWWDHWWRLRDRFEAHLIPRTAWQLSRIRPVNHPARRLMAAAHFFTQFTEAAQYWHELAETQPQGVCTAFVQRWLELCDDYFSVHCSVGGRPLKQSTALVGRERAEVMTVNVLVPILAAVGAETSFGRGLLETLPLAEENAWIRQTAHTLLGPDHPPSLYRTGLRRQGLLQIFHDYCLNDRSRCAACALPHLLSD